MAKPVKPVQRRYHSPSARRSDQAEQTRRRLLEAAFPLFVERSCAGTMIAAVAAKTGVSPETIYLSLGGARSAQRRDRDGDRGRRRSADTGKRVVRDGRAAAQAVSFFSVPNQFFTVSRRTSSRVVIPDLIFTSPLCRRVSIPSLTAWRLISRAGAPARMRSWILSDISMTS